MTYDLRVQQSVIANLSRRPAAVDVGPFVAGLDDTTDSPFINYATPHPGAVITAADVTLLVDTFRAAGRKPRLEYVTGCAPRLEALLLAAGFEVEARHTYLVCRPDTVQVPSPPTGYTVTEPGTDAARAAMITAQNEAFGSSELATDADVERIRRLQSDGGFAVSAATSDGGFAESAVTSDGGFAESAVTSDGLGVGGGVAVPPFGGASEVAGIAVRPAHRRRGLAGAITAGLTARLFAAGADLAWLEASGDDSDRVYQRVGYRPSGDRLYISLP